MSRSTLFEAGVLPKELQEIAQRRGQIPPPDRVYEVKQRYERQQRQAELADNFKDAHIMRPFGVGLSGGGIRSATFNLGILQGLSQFGILQHIDYLSTVSGGGYIGSWLHGLIRNKFEGDLNRAASFLSPKSSPVPLDPGNDPITFLRKYSNYLAPRPGFFSADSWVIGFIWLRNFLLNQLILIPSLAAIVCGFLILGFVNQMDPPYQDAQTTFGHWIVAAVEVLIALGSIVAALIIAGRKLKDISDQTFPAETEKRKCEAEETTRLEKKAPQKAADDPTVSNRDARITVLLIFLAAVLLSRLDARIDPLLSQVAIGYPVLRWLVSIGLGVLFGVVFYRMEVLGGFNKSLEKKYSGKNWWYPFLPLAVAVIAAALATALVAIIWQWPLIWNWPSVDEAIPWARLAFAPSLVCLSILAGTTVLVGLMGVDFPDAAREWTARLATMLAMTCAAWTALFFLSVFGPYTVAWLSNLWAGLPSLASFGWLATTIAGVLAGRSSKTGGKTESSNTRSLLDRFISIAPAVFMLGYLILIAFAVHLVVRANVTWSIYDDYFKFLTPTLTHWWWLGVAFVVSVVVGLIASSRININEFSLHHFYKNRLVRCYLGASNPERRPNFITGFDPNDDFDLSSLRASNANSYAGPYAIANMALNVNVGTELATQERKSLSFVMTPHFCGFEQPGPEKKEAPDSGDVLEEGGYRETLNYAYRCGPNLGTAMAISGAAANPNAGFHTAGPVAFLLTVFNARLGWWLGNPRWREASKHPGPTFSLIYMFSELFALTTRKSKFVNVSDGGHFDNLGLYELVRRRCRYIILGDGEQDGDLTFGSLGQAIRMVRADFGVEIDIDPTPIKLTGEFSFRHCVVGTITYPELEQGNTDNFWDSAGPRPQKPCPARGWLLYLKSSLTGDEPADVIEYRSRYRLFPHQSTADQFFSESQFESYRRLGLHIVRAAFEGMELDDLEWPPPPDSREPAEGILSAFQFLARKWYSPPPLAEAAMTRLNDTWTALQSKINQSPELRPLIQSPPPGARPVFGIAAEVYATGVELIQLMQNVYTEFKLEHDHNRTNPRNAGWMNLFRTWASSPVFQSVWRQESTYYNLLFGQFVENLQNGVTDVQPRP